MNTSISSGTASAQTTSSLWGPSRIQQLQARQAFSPQKPKDNPIQQAQPFQPEELSPPEDSSPKMQASLWQIIQPMFQELQTMSQSMGYVGLTEGQVARAYTTGESLLADYTA